MACSPPVELGTRGQHLEEVEELDRLFRELCPIIQEYELQNTRPDEFKVIEYRTPSDLCEAIDVTVPQEEGSVESFLQSCKDTLKFSVRTGNPRFMNQLYAASNPAGQLSELLISVLNSTVHTYSAGPVFAVVETYVISKIAELLGFDPKQSDGIFVPGGSYANLAALMAARSAAFPHVAQNGWSPQDRPVVYTSAHAHYSILKAVMIMGIGAASLVDVPVDAEGKMIPSELEKAIEASKAQGKTPMAVCAVAGTTVLGAFDPFEQVSAICQRHGVWLHVDGAWGGAVLMSARQRGLLAGAAAADSFCFNPHKLLGVPLQCSVLLVGPRRPRALRAGCGDGIAAEYLFHDDEDSAAAGTAGGGAAANAGGGAGDAGGGGGGEGGGAGGGGVGDGAVAAAAVGVCGERLGAVTAELHWRMRRGGRLMVNFSPLADLGLPNFFRAVIISPHVTTADLDFILEELDRLGQDL